MFLLKKLISPLLFPVPVILFLLLIGIVRIWTRKKSDGTRGVAWLIAAAAVLIVFSFRPVPSMMMSSLEHDYPTIVEPPDSTVSWVVVLGGGVSDDPSLGTPHRLSASSVVRFVEGVRLLRRLPSAKIVFSGGGPFSTVTEASVMRSLALDLGVPDSVIVVEERSLDTKDQALAIAGIVNKDQFLLVTSAMHMPRSMALFERQNLAPIAAPTDHAARTPTSIHPGSFYPSSLNIKTARQAWREYLGRAWASIRGQA
jgi:uncharacterized SAM-binding protein YcdF (DUF218 family)